MSRYVNRIQVNDPNGLTDEIAAFLKGKGFNLVGYRGETVWQRQGFNCTQNIIIYFEAGAVIITAFINFYDFIMGEAEMGIKGFVALVGKRPLKKIVKALEEMIKSKNK